MSPAPAGNQNRFEHGLRGALSLGSLPPGASYVRKLVGRFRRAVEQTALDVHGSLGLYELSLAQSATRHELRAVLATRYLRDSGDGLPLADKLALLKTISDATDARDRCLRSLRLDTKPEADVWAWPVDDGSDATTEPHRSPQGNLADLAAPGGNGGAT